MAKTLLDGVNEVLSLVSVISSDLASLTDSAKQVFIDTAIQKWNESIDNLYMTANQPRAKSFEADSIVLVADLRDYALPKDLSQLRFPLRDETNGNHILLWEPGYEDLISKQLIPGNFTGLPNFACVRPDTGDLYLDTLPTSADAGREYKYLYYKDKALTLAADKMPFTDIVFRAMVPAVAELWKAEKESSFNEKAWRRDMGRAAKMLTQVETSTSYRPRASSNARSRYFAS